jgi:ATP-dependent Clp protease ATP-binding subunit ClpX
MDTTPDDGEIVICSFCGKTSLEVSEMIQGENAAICDECVAGCIEIINQSRSNQPPPEDTQP